jgi:hypothetical protein
MLPAQYGTKSSLRKNPRSFLKSKAAISETAGRELLSSRFLFSRPWQASTRLRAEEHG